MEVTCWNCSHKIQVDSVDSHWIMQCPHCEKNFQIRIRKLPDRYHGNLPKRVDSPDIIASIPIEEYISEVFHHSGVESLEYLTSAKRGTNWGLLIFLGTATLGIVPLVAVIIHLLKPRPKPPLRGYEAEAYIDTEVQHLVITEPRDGVRTIIDLIPINRLRMVYIPISGFGDEADKATAFFYYGNVRLGEYPNSQINVDKINVQITNAMG